MKYKIEFLDYIIMGRILDRTGLRRDYLVSLHGKSSGTGIFCEKMGISSTLIATDFQDDEEKAIEWLKKISIEKAKARFLLKEYKSGEEYEEILTTYNVEKVENDNNADFIQNKILKALSEVRKEDPINYSTFQLGFEGFGRLISVSKKVLIYHSGMMEEKGLIKITNLGAGMMSITKKGEDTLLNTNRSSDTSKSKEVITIQEIKKKRNNKKLQVFISSTFEDMKSERLAAIESILDAGHIPAGMELFSANDESQWSVIKKWISSSDTFILLLGGRYGTMKNDEGIAYIEAEYNYAKSIDKKPFVIICKEEFLKYKETEQPEGKFREKEYIKKYEQFKKAFTDGKMCAFYENPDKLKYEIFKTLKEYESDDGFIGWIRADAVPEQSFDSGYIEREQILLYVEHECEQNIKMLNQEIELSGDVDTGTRSFHGLNVGYLIEFSSKEYRKFNFSKSAWAIYEHYKNKIIDFGNISGMEHSPKNKKQLQEMLTWVKEFKDMINKATRIKMNFNWDK
jgi:hypothetical protein